MTVEECRTQARYYVEESGTRKPRHLRRMAEARGALAEHSGSALGPTPPRWPCGPNENTLPVCPTDKR